MAKGTHCHWFATFVGYPILHDRKDRLRCLSTRHIQCNIQCAPESYSIRKDGSSVFLHPVFDHHNLENLREGYSPGFSCGMELTQETKGEDAPFVSLVPAEVGAESDLDCGEDGGQPQEGKPDVAIPPPRPTSVARRNRRSRAASLACFTKVCDLLFEDCKDVNASLEDPIGRAYFIAYVV